MPAATTATSPSSVDRRSSKKKGGLFSSMGKKKTGDATVRKTKFKKIKGFLKGEKKSKKTEAASESAPPPPSPAQTIKEDFYNDDDPDASSTVYNVDVDDRSLASASTAATRTDTSGSLLGGGSKNADDSSAKRNTMLKVVLLLMDPQTRRFELLQLEFDSMKALVSDVLAQIPLSVTEASLREQSFESIVGKDGREMTRKQLLADYCKGNEVLVAVPKGSTAKECSRLARPILGDDKVISMLKSSGIDATAWKDPKKRKSKSNRKLSTSKTRSVAATVASIKEEQAESGSDSQTSSAKVMLVLAVIVCILGAAHWYLSKPIQRGERLFPGTIKSKCGILTFDPECENEYMVVGFDGTVTSYNNDWGKMWEMTGAVCGNQADCQPGMTVTTDGDVHIGSERVLYVDIQQRGLDLDGGFPFATKPRIKRQ